MGRKIAIVTDGASSMTMEEAEKFGVYTAPIYVIFGEKTYRSGVDLQASEFYALQSASKELPSTAQTTANDFVALYTKIAEDADEIITITISSKLSATFQSAEMAQKLFTKIPVHTVDSESASWGQTLIAIAAARAANQGKNADEIIHLIEVIKERMNVFFVLDTLEYLHKGGRIGGAAAFFGSALHIKPILYLKDGKIESYEKQRTRKRSIARILEILEEKAAGKTIHIAILHGNSTEEAAEIEDYVRKKYSCFEIFTVDIGPVIGVHTGPGTLGLAFYSLD